MSAMAGILAGLRDLIEGATGQSTCKVAPGRFKHVTIDVEKLGPNAGSRPPRPFSLDHPGLVAGAAELGDMTSASHMRTQHQLDIKIAYGPKPQRLLELDQEIEDDELQLCRALELEANIALTAGWTGCRIVGTTVREGGEGDPPPLVLLVVTLEVDHRDARMT